MNLYLTRGPLQKHSFVILSNKKQLFLFRVGHITSVSMWFWDLGVTPCHTKSWLVMIGTQLRRSPGDPT